MFTEPIIRDQQSGWIEVICGPMFSGKTEELIRRLKRARIADLKVMTFKPSLDERYHTENIVSHDAQIIESRSVIQANEILSLAGEAEVVGIDEVQFFDGAILDVCNQLASKGARVIVAGLDMDYKRKPFGLMPELMATAEYITKLHAICIKCGNTASFTYRKSSFSDQFMLGEKDAYEARCRSCYEKERSTLTIE